ncbi:MAG: bifunctional aspartate kinase/homoserine dehydrogenase I [Spirosomaceae bacterium]|nr:bifunctional aspartate kinase/homoserine dehydrogenase I [Spirosomataceae bacterium]
MKVLKFGGTSCGTVESIQQVIQILKTNIAEGEKIAVVYSAMGGVTNKLIEIGRMAATGNTDYLNLCKAVEERHFAAVRGLIDVKNQSSAIAKIKGLVNELEDLLRGIFLIRELSPRTLDLLMSFGERLSTTLITEALKAQAVQAEFCDARALVRTNDHFGYAEVDFDVTNAQIRAHFAQTDALQCITGFIGATTDGITTTLGRGGSDFTGSIFGAALDADVIEIWTDVDGMMTADPRKVSTAFTIPTITYPEAMELSHFGAKVIYPPSLQPAFVKNIPIKVLNTFNVASQGTTVHTTSDQTPYAITGISSIDDIALMNVQGSGLIGVAGVSARLFSALSRHKISVILISQASSEHSICFAIDPKNADRAKEVLEQTFAPEINAGDIDRDGIQIQRNLSIIAIVGEGMRRSTGVSGKLFTALGKNGINVVATAQGSSELNISVVIQKNDLSKALNAIHGVFFQSEVRSLNLFLVGTGLIGGAFLKQLAAQSDYLRKEKLIKINVCGLARTKKMLLDPAGIDLNDWQNRLKEEGKTTSIEAYIKRISEFNLPNSVFIDCTSDKDIIQYYQPLLDASVSIVTPNKVANSGSYAEYRRLQQTAVRKGVKFLYETNVGAGLPIIGTMQGLMASGDTFLKIEAILSGTLSFIFNNFKPGTKFADIVREAKAKGYTEPDPRDDLSGLDVARKILILARETGVPLEPSDVVIDPILPKNCLEAPSVEAFFEELENSDAYFAQLIDTATAQGGVLRYIASLENGKVVLSLQTVTGEHPFYALSGADNIVSFTTERYNTRPLVIKGPGAGAEVTASGVFADMMSISSYLA